MYKNQSGMEKMCREGQLLVAYNVRTREIE